MRSLINYFFDDTHASFRFVRNGRFVRIIVPCKVFVETRVLATIIY